MTTESEPTQFSPADSPATVTEVETVRSALIAFGLTVDAEDLAAIASGWSLQRAAVDRLWDPPEARYAEPALRFRADAVAHPWI